MAGKFDDIDKEIEQELNNLSLDELSTSDADSIADADQIFPNSPPKDSVSFLRNESLVVFFSIIIIL